MKKHIGLCLALLLWGCSKMATYSIVPVLADGFSSAPSGTAYFYQPGTSVPLVIYGDNAGTAITNPVTLSATGGGITITDPVAPSVVTAGNACQLSDGASATLLRRTSSPSPKML